MRDAAVVQADGYRIDAGFVNGLDSWQIKDRPYDIYTGYDKYDANMRYLKYHGASTSFVEFYECPKRHCGDQLFEASPNIWVSMCIKSRHCRWYAVPSSITERIPDFEPILVTDSIPSQVLFDAEREGLFRNPETGVSSAVVAMAKMYRDAPVARVEPLLREEARMRNCLSAGMDGVYEAWLECRERLRQAGHLSDPVIVGGFVSAFWFDLFRGITDS